MCIISKYVIVRHFKAQISIKLQAVGQICFKLNDFVLDTH